MPTKKEEQTTANAVVRNYLEQIAHTAKKSIDEIQEIIEQASEREQE